jgi:hypothetical protein
LHVRQLWAKAECLISGEMAARVLIPCLLRMILRAHCTAPPTPTMRPAVVSAALAASHSSCVLERSEPLRCSVARQQLALKLQPRHVPLLVIRQVQALAPLYSTRASPEAEECPTPLLTTVRRVIVSLWRELLRYLDHRQEDLNWTKRDSRLLALMLVLPVAVVPVRRTATVHGIPLVSAAMVDFQLLPTLELAEAVPLAVEDGLTRIVIRAMIAKLAVMAEAGVSTFGTKDRLVFCSLFHSF